MSKMTATAQEVREQFLITQVKMDEATNLIRDTLREQWDKDKAIDLIVGIMDEAKEQLEKEGHSLTDWNLLDRLTWIAKEAYIIGFLQSFENIMSSNEMAYKTLFG